MKLTVIENSEGLFTNGEDIVTIQFDIADFQGKRFGTDSRLVDFEIEGPAEWLGPVDKEDALQGKAVKAKNGTNRVLIRSTKTPGEIKITARAKGLAPTEVTLNSKSAE